MQPPRLQIVHNPPLADSEQLGEFKLFAANRPRQLGSGKEKAMLTAIMIALVFQPTKSAIDRPIYYFTVEEPQQIVYGPTGVTLEYDQAPKMVFPSCARMVVLQPMTGDSWSSRGSEREANVSRTVFDVYFGRSEGRLNRETYLVGRRVRKQ